MRALDLRLPFVGLIALVALVACGRDDRADRPCPFHGVLTDADVLSAFSSGTDPANLVYRVAAGNTELSCTYHGMPRGIRLGSNAPADTLHTGTVLAARGVRLAPEITESLCQSAGESADQAPADEDGRPKKLGRITGTFKATIAVSRGPAMTGTKVTVPYFVAIMRSKKFVLARQEYSASLDLGSKQQVTETVSVPIEIPLAEGTMGGSYEVLIGLVLTPEQLAHNRQHLPR